MYTLVIKNVLFLMHIPKQLALFYLRRIKLNHSIHTDIQETVDIIIKPKYCMSFANPKFETRSEPIFVQDGFYREVPHVGVFSFSHSLKKIEVLFSPNIISNSALCENLVDATLQIIDLSMIYFDVIPVHAAAVIKNNRGIIIMGNSGAGKTTTEAGLIAMGHSFFADDIVFLDSNVQLYNNMEYILGLRRQAEELLTNQLGMQLEPDNSNDEKRLLYFPEVRQANYKPLCVLLPVVDSSDNSSSTPYEIHQLNNAELYIHILELTLSTEFPTSIIRQYMTTLLKLCKITTGFEIIRKKSYVSENCIALFNDLNQRISNLFEEKERI